MPKTRLDLRSGRPLLDLVSYGRGGPKGSIHLSADHIAAIDRTVRRVPEVMVKVLPKDSNNLRSVGRHLDYIGRYGKLELETDDAERVQGKDAGKQLLEDWDLDLDEDRKQLGLSSVSGRAPKLVHKIMLSMPPGTPAKGVLEGARNFAREEFALRHRYALVLHADEPHPHVHLVVKAMSEQGMRLNISPVTLRGWRREFARHLREQGIAANATERAVRGETRKSKKDGIYRSNLRGDSTYVRTQTEAVAAELLKGSLRGEPGKHNLAETRKTVESGWRSVANQLSKDGHHDLARDARRFVDGMSKVRTERELIADELISQAKAQSTRENQRSR
jgi:hypothetical protein